MRGVLDEVRDVDVSRTLSGTGPLQIEVLTAMNKTFGAEVKRLLAASDGMEHIESFVDWKGLESADRAETLTLLFGRESASNAKYQALTAQEVATLLAKMLENAKGQQREATQGSVVEGILNLLNGIA